MSYLRDLCLFVYSGVQHILTCAFVLLVFVVCTICCQFLWIDLFFGPSVFSIVYSQKNSQKLQFVIFGQ